MAKKTTKNTKSKYQEVYILHYTGKHGSDITVYKTFASAKKMADKIKKEWYPKSKTYRSVYDDTFGEASIEILSSYLEE